jgi:5'-nucleotidase
MKRILLTGDDGYNAVGTRLLIAALKPHYELAIVGTKIQQSGVGGYINVTKTMPWGKTLVDGVPAVWLAGTPADAMEFARQYFPKPFDLVLSGINMGVNIGASLTSSGTYAAAYRALGLGIAPHAIAISWAASFHLLYRNHSGRETIKAYAAYPGEAVARFVNLAWRNKFWGAQLMNVNLPEKPTAHIRFTRPLLHIYGYWPPVIIKTKPRTFSYGPGLPKRATNDPSIDAVAVEEGDISVMLATVDMTDERAYKKVKGKRIPV